MTRRRTLRSRLIPFINLTCIIHKICRHLHLSSIISTLYSGFRWNLDYNFVCCAISIKCLHFSPFGRADLTTSASLRSIRGGQPGRLGRQLHGSMPRIFSNLDSWIIQVNYPLNKPASLIAFRFLYLFCPKNRQLISRQLICCRNYPYFMKINLLRSGKWLKNTQPSTPHPPKP